MDTCDSSSLFYCRCTDIACANRASAGSGSPCNCAASSSPHSSARVRPRAPIAVHTHRPGSAAALIAPTMGKRSCAVQRTPAQACTAVGDERDDRLGGSCFDGKGQPGQVSAVSHGSSTARFNGINVINTARSLG